MKAKDLYFYLSAVVALLIFLSIGYIIFNSNFSAYKYVVPKGNVDFVSNSDEPGVLLDGLRAAKNVLVSPEFVEQGPQNAYATSAVTLFSTVFIAKGKKVTILARVLDEKGNLASCSTNFGDPKRNEKISLEQCSAMLADNSYAKILVPLPDRSLPKPIVVLDSGVATVRAPTLEAVPYTCFALAEAIYPDAKSIIDSVNGVLGSLK